ncbi:hypothetical protein EJ08DRAFT_695603 [Tothia fuscella]|uniref:Uncharacterized protein n=1 Tax=Tothia fuscella TaxID=1048955 RepID=A0A9P4NVH3_9PEZI|nr:hypothetical protein EJ08DRAFT_695603 [Tothia fuscella]
MANRKLSLFRTGDHPKLNLTSEEKKIFGILFKQADTKDDGIVTGEAAINLFPRAKLPEAELGTIWALADTDNRGYLLQEDFAKALRLIAHYQSNPTRQLLPQLALEPSPPGFPKFEGLNMGPVRPPNAPAIQAQNSGSIRIPPLTNDKIAGYTKMFEGANPRNGTLDGSIARSFFEKSGLPQDTLGHVWNLADTEQRSALSCPEFIIAMHLLASLRNNTLTALPAALPAGLIEAASRKPPMQPQVTSALPRQFSGANAGRTSSPLSRQPAHPPFGSPKTAQGTWVIPPQELANFYSIFETYSVDKGNPGIITAEQAVEFFGQSGMDQDTLAAIWDLSTVRKLDQLNRDEFAIALFLIQSQRNPNDRPPLPTVLPPSLIPPGLRAYASGAQAPAPVSAPAPPPAPSAAEDLFGLDAFSNAPTTTAAVPQQSTGGSGNFGSDAFKLRSLTTQNFSQPTGDTPFKRFIPTSSWGQTLNSQNTGGSGTSSTVQSRDIRPSNNPMDDLLGDNDPEISKKLTQETSDFANMSNQVRTLQTQMQDVQTKKNVTEADLQSTNTQRRDLELRLNQFRSRYEQELKSVRTLEDQLTTSRKESQKLQSDLAEIEGDYTNLQNQQRQLQGALENERRENSGLKERMRQINAETAQLRPLLEKLRNEARHEKGMVSINKKQLEKSETERDSMKNEVNDLTRAAQAATRSPPAEYNASPAPSTGSTNPFFRKSPQPSFDNTMNPGGFAQPQSKEANKYDNIFGPSYSSSPSTSSPAPVVAFRGDNAQTAPEDSVTSSEETSFPTPSASPVPPPASRQFTGGDLPFHGPRGGESVATSVRVETPSSRYDGADTPTNVGGSSPIAQGFQRPDHARTDTQTSTGAAMFDRKNTNASPAGNTTSDASSRPQPANFFGTSIPGAFPEPTPLQPDMTGNSGFSQGSKQSAPRSDGFSFPPQPSRTTTGKSDFDQAFATVGSSSKQQPQARQMTGSSTNGSLDDPMAKFPPVARSEFPPLQLKESDSESDSEAGFDDDFTQASPRHNRKTSQPPFGESRPSKDVPSHSFFSTQPSASELPTPGVQKSPPTYEQSGASGAGPHHGSNDFPPEFGGLLPSRDNPMSPLSQVAQSPDRSFVSPASGSQGHALFGSGPSTNKSASTAPTTAFSGSPPPTTSTPVSTVPSDAYHSAPSYPSGSTEKSQQSSQHRSPPAGNDDFDSGFDDLTEAKENDNRDEDDFMFGSQHDETFDQFDPAFDSPAMSKSGTMASERTPTASGQASTAFDSSFGDFESNFSSAKGVSQPSASGTASKAGASGGAQDDWETMMQSISGPSGATAKDLGFGDGPDLNFSGVAAPMPPPSAPSPPTGGAMQPPKLGRSVTAASEHDYDDLKKLMALGYKRSDALGALEKYDYDFQKAIEHLSK